MKFTTATLTVAALAASTAAFPMAYNGTAMAHNGSATHTVTKTVRLEAGSPKPVTTPSASNDKLLKLIIENLEAGGASTIQKGKLDAIENSLSSVDGKKLGARQTEDPLSMLISLFSGSLGLIDPALLEGLLGGLGGADGGDGSALGGLEGLTGGAPDLGSGLTGGQGGLDSSFGGLSGNPGGEGGDLGSLTGSLGGLAGGLEGLGGDSPGAPKEDGGNQLLPGQDDKKDNGKGPDLGSITDSLPKLPGKDKGKTPDVNGTISSLQSLKGKPEDGEGHKDKSKDGNDDKGKTDNSKDQ